MMNEYKYINCRSGNYKSVLHYSNIKRVILQKWSPILRGLYQKIACKLHYLKIMKLFADYRSETNVEFDHIELGYSSLMWLSGNHKWFCRIWRKDWVKSRYLKYYGASYGRNKFEAYRLALKDLKK